MVALPPGRWSVDAAASSIAFALRVLGLRRARGRFGGLGGWVESDGGPRADGRGWVDAASISTGVDSRDRHLRSRAFLDVERHGRIELEPACVSRAASTLEISGRLRFKGVVRPLRLLCVLTRHEGDRVRLVATGRVRRSDLALRPPRAVALNLIPDRVDLVLDLVLVRDRDAGRADSLTAVPAPARARPVLAPAPPAADDGENRLSRGLLRAAPQAQVEA